MQSEIENIVLTMPELTYKANVLHNFTNKALFHYNELMKLNRMTPIQKYDRKYMLHMWKQTIYCARQGYIPLAHPLLHPQYIQDENANTIAMILAKQGIIVPYHWLHSPRLRNSSGHTVAMIYAMQGIMPPKEWEHDAQYTVRETGENVIKMLIKWFVETHPDYTQSDFDEWYATIPKHWLKTLA